MASSNHPLLAVIGPTGSGKSQLAVTLASFLRGEIVNFDSIQVYRGLDVGSAKPTAAEQSGIPHHLLNILDIREELTAGDFARRSRAVLHDITQRNSFPILVGGTGFYLRALLDGLSPAPPRDEDLRAKLTERRPKILHRVLRRRDPAAAARIHPNDRQKIIRAIELTVLAGRPATETQAQPRRELQGYSVLKIGLHPSRPALREKLDRRVADMFASGLLEETRALLDEGVAPDTKALQSLGYKQAVAYLTGGVTLEAAIEDTQIKTRQYAKRQMTWFRAERDVFWLSGFGSESVIQEQALVYVRNAALIATR